MRQTSPACRGRTSRRAFLKATTAGACAFMVAPRLSAQTAGPTIRVRGINHVTLAVADVTRSVDFYQGLFGMPVISRQGATVNLQIGTGPQFLEIAPASGTPSISHICLGVEGFNASRVAGVLTQAGLMAADPSAGAGLGGPLRLRSLTREGTPEIFITDPDGVVVQLQDPGYCGGSGPLGEVAAREPSTKKGLIALRDWSHCTIF